MSAVLIAERRRSRRRVIHRAAKLQAGSGGLPRDCVVTDISPGGVRLHAEGYDVPDHFVLHLSGEDVPREAAYRVVWRLGREVGARLVAVRQRVGSPA